MQTQAARLADASTFRAPAAQAASLKRTDEHMWSHGQGYAREHACVAARQTHRQGVLVGAPPLHRGRLTMATPSVVCSLHSAAARAPLLGPEDAQTLGERTTRLKRLALERSILWSLC